MSAFLAEWYLWIKAFHIIFVITWMAGLFYLPRLFVYHSRAKVGSERDKEFQVMERKLLRIIMNPSFIMVWVLGLSLFFTPGLAPTDAGWVWVKGAAVIGLTIFHHALALWRKDFVAGKNTKSEKFFRKANEVPTVLVAIIVIMVVVKPF
jgi:putative membrane protein